MLRKTQKGKQGQGLRKSEGECRISMAVGVFCVTRVNGLWMELRGRIGERTTRNRMPPIYTPCVCALWVISWRQFQPACLRLRMFCSASLIFFPSLLSFLFLLLLFLLLTCNVPQDVVLNNAWNRKNKGEQDTIGFLCVLYHCSSSFRCHLPLAHILLSLTLILFTSSFIPCQLKWTRVAVVLRPQERTETHWESVRSCARLCDYETMWVHLVFSSFSSSLFRLLSSHLKPSNSKRILCCCHLSFHCSVIIRDMTQERKRERRAAEEGCEWTESLFSIALTLMIRSWSLRTTKQTTSYDSCVHKGCSWLRQEVGWG